MADDPRSPGAGPGGEPIAIVGMAALYPGAGGVERFWANIVGGVDAIREAPPGRWDDEFYRPDAAATPPPGTPRADRLYTRRGGFVDELATFDPTEFGIMPLAVEWAEPDQLLALRLAAEAIADGGGADRLTDRERVGVVLGRGGYFGPAFARIEQRVKTARQVAVTLREVLPDLPDEAVERVHDAFVAKLGPERPEAAIGLVPNLAASRIANRLDLRGPAYTVDAACASSLVAVDSGVRELRLGRADTMIVGGAHIVHEPTFWSTFAMLRALSPSQRIRPFDKAADGVLIGEGIGMLVLRRLSDALAAGDPVHAVVRGTGMASDGRTSSLMATASQGQALAVRRAWADAGLDPRAPGAVGLIEAHGTATPTGDAAELASMAEIFGPAGAGPVIGLGSVKSMIGHTMPAAGAAGLIKAALALRHGTLPPTLHCDDPHSAFDGTRFAPVLAATPWGEPAGGGPRRAGVNAFGFGGINAHAVLEEAPDRPSPSPAGTFPAPALAASATASSPTAEPVLLFAAATPAELAAQLAVPDEELLARDDAGSPPAGGPCRLALVAPTPRRLALARTIVARGTPWRGRNDLWFTTAPLLGPGAGRLAFLFCGLEDNFTPRIDDVCAHFGLPLPDLGETEVLGGHGRASIEVGRVLDVALRRLGIVPDLVGGHSIGEWNAMISAGMIPTDFADAFIQGFDPGSVEVPGVCFGALGCGVELAGEAIAGLPDVVVSHDNCPHQSVICGLEASVTEALARLRAQGVLGQVLPFRSGFHSPFLRPYLAQATRSLATMPLRRPGVPVWSATTVAPYPDDSAQIRELAARHLLEPVRFRQLTERLHAEGARVFVQVGIGSVAGFVDDTLATAGTTDHLTAVSNSPKRTGLDQLRRVAAALWAEGGAPRLDLLPCRHPAASAATAAGATAASPAAGEARPQSVARRGGQPVLLRLGSPIVRLGPQAPELLGEPTSAGAPAQAAPARSARPAGPVTGLPDQRRGSDVAGPPAGIDLVAAIGAGTGEPTGHPVLAELGLALAETAAVLADVRATWDQRRAPAAPVSVLARPPALPVPLGTPQRPVTSPAPAAALPDAPPGRPPLPPGPPPGGPTLGGTGPITTTARRTLSLADLPHVIDHCFYRQPPGWQDLSDRFPVMPMTAILQMMIDEARALVPGRVVVGVRDVRALRWVAIEPPVEVTIACTELPDGAVRVSMDGYARVTVVFGDAYPAAPARTVVSVDLAPEGRLPDEVPSPHQAAELYGGRWMFHGPSYQGITHVDAIAPLGARGQLVVTGAPGALLDAIGQLYGYWATQYLDVDSLLLPQAVGEMRFYGPDPAPGDRLTCVTRIRDIAAKTVTADLEVRAADGTVWCEVVGWTDRRFTANAWLWLLMRDPERNTVAEPRPDGWVVVPDYWRDIASRELVVRHFLDADRRKVLAGKNPRAAREWLLGRIAASDAVRRWLWARGAGPVWGIEVVVDNDPSGRPAITRVPSRPGIPTGPLPNLSIAHKVDLAVALVDDEGDVGIDLEAVAVRAPGVYAAGLAPAERRLLAALAGGAADPAHGSEAIRAPEAPADDDAPAASGPGVGDDSADQTAPARTAPARTAPARTEAAALAEAAWFARIWAAKEAVAKADGTGLQGRPRRYVVDLVVPVGTGATDFGADLAAELGLAVEPPAAEILGPDQVTADGIKSPPPRPAESARAEPPLLMRVTVLADPEPAAFANGDDPSVTGYPRRRWVALRTVDGMGRVRHETGGGAAVRVGDHIVAWTSPSVERAARARLPRGLSGPAESGRGTEPPHVAAADPALPPARRPDPTPVEDAASRET